jgi:hypothetical protein
MFAAPHNPLFAARPVLAARAVEDEVIAARRRFEALFNKESTCAYCGVTYLEQNNLGTLKCPVTEHSGLWTGDVWSCCKSKDYFNRGCVRSDHSHFVQVPLRWIGDRSTITIPSDQIDDIETPIKFELVEPRNITHSEPVILAKITRSKMV